MNQLAKSGMAQFINYLQQQSHVAVMLPNATEIKSVLGVPLEQDGNLLGILILTDHTQADRFNHRDVNRASIFGVQAAIALQNAKLFAELTAFNEQLDSRVAERTRALNEESSRVKILLKITTELSSSLDQDQVLGKTLTLVNEVVNATQGVILLIDQETNEMVFRTSFGNQVPESTRTGMMSNEGLSGWIINNKESVIIQDTHNDDRWIHREASREHRSVLAVPLMGNDEVMGVLMLFHSRPHAFSSQQLDLVEAAAVQVSHAIGNAKLYQLIREQAERLSKLLQTEQVETAKNSSILQSIADGVLVANEQGTITLANTALSNILDTPQDKLIGHSINDLLGLYGHSGEKWRQAIEAWSQVDQINPEDVQIFSEQIHAENKFISVNLAPVFARTEFIGTVSIFRDITKEVEVDRLKSEFVSTVSHELRTPMTSIKGYADLMLMGATGQMNDGQLQYLKVIKSNADRLHTLVNDLLDISRIETGKTRLDLRPLDITQVIEQLIDSHLQMQIQQEGKHVTVNKQIPPSLPLVNADKASIIQVLTNLLDNALNYTNSDGTIRIIAKSVDNFVSISIQDTGIGISEENMARIFERFFRAEDQKVQQVRGTGLGLPIVRSLIEMHGGELNVESVVGEGSTFSFLLPMVMETDNDPTGSNELV